MDTADKTKSQLKRVPPEHTSLPSVVGGVHQGPVSAMNSLQSRPAPKAANQHRPWRFPVA